MTHTALPSSFTVRRGAPADLPQLVDLADRSFTEEGPPGWKASEALPHLFAL